MASPRYAHLKRCLKAEVLRKRPAFSWWAIAGRLLCEKEKRFYFLWRLAEYLHTSPSHAQHWLAQKITHRLYYAYGCDIELGTCIGPGLRIRHFSGIVINKHAHIGANCTLRQNTTIGAASPDISRITLGDNVSVGANVCIVGDNLQIGNNVTIGAAAFINKNIADNSVCYSRHVLVIREKKLGEQTL